MTQDMRSVAREAAYHRQMKLLLILEILEIVDAAIAAEISARRDQNPLRRRWRDETMVTTSRLALAAGRA